MLKVTISHVSINLCGAERCVAQKLLHAREWSSGIEHVGGHGVAHHVGAQPGGMGSPFAKGAMNHIVDHLPVEWLAVVAHQQGGLRVAGCDSCSGRRIALATVIVDSLGKLRAERDHSFFITLAKHF